MTSKTDGFKEVIFHNESLDTYIKKLGEFDSAFCKFMLTGSDFTLRFEVRGNLGEIHHVRVYQDDIARPKGSQKRVDAKVDLLEKSQKI